VRLVNDLEGIPNAEVGGGGLSPRLEAELIAMLSRPAYQAPPAADRATIAALGSIVGLLVGVLGLSAVLWVNSLIQGLREQSDRLKDLGVVVRDTAAGQRMAIDALLRRSDPADATSGKLIDDYKLAVRDLDAAKAKADDLASAVARLERQGKDLEALQKETQEKLAKAEERIKENESEAKDAKTLRRELADAQEQVKDLKSKVEAKSEQLAVATDPAKAEELISRARWSTYLAVAGWVVAILLGVAAAALWAQAHPIPVENAEPPPSPSPTQEQAQAPPPGEAPHVITE
jgi:hypothetical protein